MQIFHSRRLRALALVALIPCTTATLLLAASATAAAAQATEGYVAGLVRGADGAPVADATITARNDATGFQEVRRTDARGRFVFAQLPIGGPYTITARKIGLQAERRTGITLNLGDRVSLDYTLKVATAELAAVDVRGDRRTSVPSG
jgi:hypothetical protein